MTVEAQAWAMLKKLEGEDFTVAVWNPDILERLERLAMKFSESDLLLERIAALQHRITIAKVWH